MKKLFRTFVLLLLAGSSPLQAEVSENTLKAVLVEKFTHFIVWPQVKNQNDSKKIFVICVLGEAPIKKEFEKLSSLITILRKPVKVKAVLNEDDVNVCDLVYFNSESDLSVAVLLENTRGLPVLTVGDGKVITDKGVMIGLYSQNEKLTFSINLKRAKDSGFAMSSRLLKLANEVIQ